MKRKIRIPVTTEKRGLFAKKKVARLRTVTVDEKTYRKMRARAGKRPYSMEEMMLYDEIFDEWDE